MFVVDPAVMRPGRLDKVLYVGLPNADDRADILRAMTKVLYTYTRVQAALFLPSTLSFDPKK